MIRFILSRHGAPAGFLLNPDDAFARMEAFDLAGQGAKAFDLLVHECGLGLSVDELVSEFRHHMPEANTWVFPAAAKFLSECALPMGLITDGYWVSQLRKIEAMSLRELFDVIVVTDLLGSNRSHWKPSMLPYKTVLSSLGVEAQEAAYVGDNMAKDFIAPNELGMMSVCLMQPNQLYQGGVFPPEARPKRTFTDWVQLSQWLEANVARSET